MMKSTDFRIGDLVVYKNNQLLAFNKPAGLAVQSRPSAEEKSLLELASIYTKGEIFLTHRIDQPASGLLLMARTQKALAHLNEQFREGKVSKTYLAVVKKAPEAESGTLEHYLRKNGRRNKSYPVASGSPGAKLAQLAYRRLDQIENYTLLEIKLLTGRHHQIRVQLAAIGCPIRGDVKYGARRSNPDRSIHLHGWKMAFTHPVSGEQVELTAELPRETVWQAFKIPTDNG